MWLFLFCYIDEITIIIRNSHI